MERRLRRGKHELKLKEGLDQDKERKYAFRSLFESLRL